MIGSLLALSRMGPELSIQSVARNIDLIVSLVSTVEARQPIGTQNIVCTKAREVLSNVFEEILLFLETDQLADNQSRRKQYILDIV